jgi:hypothetical protein
MRKIRYIVATIILFLAGGFFCPDHILAQAKISLQDKMIGSTFKSLAKVFVLASDLDDLKRSNIDKINMMEEEKFRKRYTRLYEVIRELPLRVRIKYGFKENLLKEEAVKILDSFNKKRVCRLIDSVPEAVIAAEFKEYLSSKQKELQEYNIVRQVKDFWNEQIQKMKPVKVLTQ